MESKELTQEYLKSILNYDKNTGIFTWKIDKGQGKKGNAAGCTCRTHGYSLIRLSVNGVFFNYRAHRLAWFYEYGSFPKKHLDHINHNRTDNRMSNLMEATPLSNMKNLSMKKNNTSGITGVSFHKTFNRWEAYINVKTKRIKLGYFKDKNEAICARLHAQRLYKFHANHGKIL